MSNKIKILGIAPYPGLITLMKQFAQEDMEISLTPIIGNMQEGAKLAALQYQNYDAIISRAHTANLISKVVPIPVFDIGISYEDVLRCIKMAENIGEKFAFISFKTLTDIAHTIKDLLKINLDIFPLAAESETVECINYIKEMGFKTVICDTIAYDYAKSIGLQAILLTSSSKSLALAIEDAKYIYNINKVNIDLKSIMQNTLSSSNINCYVMDKNYDCLYSNLKDINIQDIKKELSENLKHCFQNHNRTFYINTNQSSYRITAQSFENVTTPYVIFYIEPAKTSFVSPKNGISVLNKEDIQAESLNDYFNNTTSLNSMYVKEKSYSLSNTNLMIVGEHGTGKTFTAHSYYKNSTYSDHPMFSINCSLLNKKNLDFVIESYKSPFTDSSNTIFISNIEQLSKESQKKLLSAILDTNVHIRNRIIFSCTLENLNVLPHVAIEFANTLNLMIISLNTLRETKEKIIAAANLYINILNQEHGTQVVGLSEDAIEHILNYDFPYNHTQLKRILKEAVLKADKPYVEGDLIYNIILKEKNLVSTAEHSSHRKKAGEENVELLQVDFNKTLDEINQTIVQHVLNQNSLNQTETAKKLGISRTTLWRYLKR